MPPTGSVVGRIARAEAGTWRSIWWAVRRHRDVPNAGLPLLRWALFAVGAYALAWALGFGLALRQKPHLVLDDELVLRLGHLHTVRVPLGTPASARRSVDAGHRRNLAVADDHLALSFMGQTSVELRFPSTVPGHRIVPATRVRFFADDPADVARRLSSRRLSPER
jgi:hypothetical protein